MKTNDTGKDPLLYFPFYCHELMGIMAKYTFEEQGAFIRVLCGFITEDGKICEQSKYRLLQAQTASERKAIDFVYSHAVGIAETIMGKQKKIREKNRENGRKGGRPKKPVG